MLRSSLLVLQDTLDGNPEVLLDPNTLSEDGTVALSDYEVSEDAKYLAYGIISSGSDWVTIKVMRVEEKGTEPDTISWVKFTNLLICIVDFLCFLNESRKELFLIKISGSSILFFLS